MFFELTCTPSGVPYLLPTVRRVTSVMDCEPLWLVVYMSDALVRSAPNVAVRWTSKKGFRWSHDERRCQMTKLSISRDDVVAAQVFVQVLPADSMEKLKADLLEKGKSGDARPDPSTRLGLALLAFTTPAIAFGQNESAKAWKRVAPLWTERERKYIDEMVHQGAQLVFREAMAELSDEYVVDGNGMITRRTDG